MAFNLGIIISGRGSNMLNIINACQNRKLLSRVSIVISNVPDAEGLKIAQKKNVLLRKKREKCSPSKKKEKKNPPPAKKKSYRHLL